MDEDDQIPLADTLCDKAETLRGIALALESTKSPEARKILKEAAKFLLATMHPPRAVVVALVPKGDDQKETKERPL